MSRTNEREVAARWAGDADGARYVSTDRWRSTRASGRDPRLVASLLRRVSAPVESVLDVPCGTGRMRSVFEPGTRWTGADVSASMLAELDRAADARVQASAFELPFADDAFDLVLCCRLLHHLESRESRQRALRELVRVARGHVIASYWDAATYGAWRRRTTSPLRRRKDTRGRQATPFAELNADIAGAGADLAGRVFSLRFVSQQSFFLATKRG